ncbi:hypothetical protein V500_07415 [Pseudogymnoascus sp. VKM F-4518 (FW-2643)]|nr:hypothetical protein V500_07415 [Pseudogymnoascus sp. VKM F-4518 (FW-2643)]
MAAESTPLKHVKHSYREGKEATELSTVDVWLPETNGDGSNPEGIWVVYIHGGAWRDPLVTSTSLLPALSHLSPFPATAQIAGYASLSYRLSPYPTHPSSPSTPVDPSRSAKHPDHLDDVTTGLLWLEKRYGIDGRYVLVGHSCGATLAFQIPEMGRGGERVPRPRCIVGSEGIYDLPALVERNQHPFYREFVVSAFGDDEATWAAASPCRAAGSPKLWEKTGLLIISHSDEDEYVEKEQSLDMLERIKASKTDAQEVVYVPAEGRHDEIHEKGGELARIIEVGVKMVWVKGWGADWGVDMGTPGGEV